MHLPEHEVIAQGPSLALGAPTQDQQRDQQAGSSSPQGSGERETGADAGQEGKQPEEQNRDSRQPERRKTAPGRSRRRVGWKLYRAAPSGRLAGFERRATSRLFSRPQEANPHSLQDRNFRRRLVQLGPSGHAPGRQTSRPGERAPQKLNRRAN